MGAQGIEPVRGFITARSGLWERKRERVCKLDALGEIITLITLGKENEMKKEKEKEKEKRN